MTLSEELQWRGFVNQTTYPSITALDGEPITFYWGVDPSAPSMTIGNFAMAMMVRHFISHGHRAILLVGGATGMIGDPDGKKQERTLKAVDEVQVNTQGIVNQYRQIFAGMDFEIVNNYDWFKGLGYLEFLRDIGKNVPMRQMLGREFVQSRLGEDGEGISYAEFSYSLIQGYDFLHLFRAKHATLQVAGADQWGNSIAGVELIRRIEGGEAHIWTGPIVINKTTGVKFGKTEGGAIWLDASLTTPTQFYQFWVNCDDAGVEEYLKIYTLLPQAEISAIMTAHRADPKARAAQLHLAREATTLVHGAELMHRAELVTAVLTGRMDLSEAEVIIEDLRAEIPHVFYPIGGSIVDALVAAGLATSITEARRFLQDNAVAINGSKTSQQSFTDTDFVHGRLLLRKGKAFKDTALVELEG